MCLEILSRTELFLLVLHNIFSLAFYSWSSDITGLQMAAHHIKKTFEGKVENVWEL